jgi:hypothetical protein
MPEQTVQLRRVPYPYRAMLAVCSDLDETPDRQTYYETARFLNTTQSTPMGPGVGLEVGNSIYFDMPPDQFAYWNTDDAGREMVRRLIRSGHVDCLHSYGDLAATRADAGRALDELARHDCRIEVWIDHSTAPTNFGADIMRGSGDVAWHPAYHADLTTGQGVRFVWRGRVTSVIGQESPASLGGLWTAGHPIASAQTVLKEACKQTLSRLGSRKYRMHAPNDAIRKTALRDGTKVHEFLRCNPHWGGVSSCETARGIGQVLTEAMLNRLVSREGVCILYTHLGKVDDPRVPFGPSAVAAFRRLAEAHREGKVLVTTTRRLLGFLRTIRELPFEVRTTQDGLRIAVETGAASAETCRDQGVSDLDGVTFYVPEPGSARLTINGREIAGLRGNGPDHTGRPSLSLPWPALRFPEEL